MSDSPVIRVIAGAVITDEAGGVLLMRRSDDGTWGLPGGGLEAGETWRQAAERECLEEIGWRVEMLSVLGVYSDPATQVHIYPDGRFVQFVGVVFSGKLVERLTEAGPEVIEVAFFPLDDLPEPIFEPDRPALARAATSALEVHID